MNHIKIYLCLFLICSLSSCYTAKEVSTFSDSNELSRVFGFKVNKNDYVPLYREAASWMGTPYRYGGNTHRGVDCSGLTSCIYQSVYKKSLNRFSGDILRIDCHRISKHKLKEGDLVFFSTGKNSRINHVGVYLKEGYFIHASTMKGVIISHIDEPYYIETWRGAGRVKK